MSSRHASFVALASLLALAGCDGATASPDAGSRADAPSLLDAPSLEDAPSLLDAPIAREDAPFALDGNVGDAGEMACSFIDSIQRSCSSDMDCAFDVHQTDCCGNTVATGIRASEAERFALLEPICRATYPLCDCPARPTQTDSGETVTDSAAVQVGCISRGPAGICMSYVAMRPMDGV